MRQVIYFSTARERQDVGIAAAILEQSRRNNQRDGITGLLVAGGNRYLQVIEGPHLAIEDLISRLEIDERHLSMNVLIDRPVRAPNFDGWAMAFRHQPRLEHFATFSDLVERMIDEVADPRLKQQLKCFDKVFAIAPIALLAEPPTPSTLAGTDLSFDPGHQ